MFKGVEFETDKGRLLIEFPYVAECDDFLWKYYYIEDIFKKRGYKIMIVSTKQSEESK